MSTGYNIAFQGELLDGFESEQVKARFAERFRLPAERVAALFGGRRTLLKKGLSSSHADAYVRELAALGLRVEVLDATGQARPAAPRAAPAAAGFRILYAGGLLPGFSRDEVVMGAGARLRLSGTQLEAMFCGREMRLKQGLDVAGARRYLDTLRALGMDARCVPPLTDEPEPAPGSAAEATPDDIEARLLAALNIDFDRPVHHTDGPPPSHAEVAKASHHMVETVLNADALRMYAQEDDEPSLTPLEEPASPPQMTPPPVVTPSPRAAPTPPAAPAASAPPVVAPPLAAPPARPEPRAAQAVPAATPPPAPPTSDAENPARRRRAVAALAAVVLGTLAIWLLMRLPG